jgi:Uma2 family endonuclease
MQTPHAMSATPRPITAEELEKRAGDDDRHELVEGRLIRMSPVGGVQAVVTAGLLARLVQHVKRFGLGVAVTELGFTLTRSPDTVRAPDVSFIGRNRIPSSGMPRGFWNGAPDLAIEVLSPDDRASEIRSRVDDYLRAGTQIVCVVDPDAQSVSVHRPRLQPRPLHGDDVLDLDDVVIGFRCSVREIFE